MKKNIIVLLVCMLLMTTIVPAVGYFKNKAIPPIVESNSTNPLARSDWEEIQSFWYDGNFGFDVSLDGDTALIGAPYDSENGYNSGCTYVYTRTSTTWTLQQKILAPDGESEDVFGCGVALYDDTALIGAPGDDDNGPGSGSVYVFTRTGTSWTYRQELYITENGSGFGCSISLDDGTALVGAFTVGPNRGSAYVFTHTGANWTFQQELVALDGAASDRFGWDVSLDGDTALIGAYRDDDNGNDSGSAYIFTRTGTTWIPQQKLLAPDGIAYDHFGVGVALDDGTIFIGAEWHLHFGNWNGSAYVFTYTGTNWTFQQELFPLENENGHRFGYSISLDGDIALIGAPYDDTSNGVDAGSVYVFTRTDTTWMPQQQLFASNGDVQNYFGYSISNVIDTAVIGAPDTSDYNEINISGKAYFFEANTPPYEPGNPNPYDGMVNVSVDPFLRWTGGDPDPWDTVTYDVYFGTTNPPPKIASNFSGTTFYALGSLLPNTTYFWEICAWDDHHTSTIGPIWQFTTGYNHHPYTPRDPIPANNSINVSVTADLSWTGGDPDYEDFVYYDIYFGFTSPPPKVVSNQSQHLLYNPGLLQDNTMYYWEIVAWDQHGLMTPGPLWQFTTETLNWSLKAKTIATDGEKEDHFGWSVSLNGDYAVIGSPGDHTNNGTDAGSAYIFKRSGMNWTQEAKLTAFDGAPSDNFGWSVSIDGDYALIGAYRGGGAEAGSAYIFKHSDMNWTQVAKLTALDGEAHDNFGSSVSLNGDYVVIGSPRDDTNGSDAGSAYIFKRSDMNWTQEARLTALDSKNNDRFGSSVSLNGDYVVIGSPMDDINPLTDAGSVYIFKRFSFPLPNWTQVAKLTALDGEAHDNFGSSVSLNGDYVVIGSPQDDTNGSDAGSAYIFKRSDMNWTQETKLTALESISTAFFGFSVSMCGDRVIVGAYGHDTNDGQDIGSAYIFKRTNTSWIEEENLTAFDGAQADNFGYSVSLSGNTTLIGAPYDDDNGLDSGSVYLFQINHIAIVNTPYGTATFQTNDGDISSLHWVNESSLPPEAIITKPAGLTLPFGLFNYTVTGLTLGQSITLTVELPGPVPVGSRWWKVDPSNTWYSLSIGDDDGDAIVTVELTDGALGDTDGTSDGIIHDPGGIGILNQPPYQPSNPTPVDHATDVDINTVLSWTGGDPDPGDMVTYDVYFDTTSPPLKVSGNQSAITYNPGTLAYSTTYYWRIVAWDSHGTSTIGSVWMFTTKINNSPPLFSTPNPANGSTENPINLTWSILINDLEGDTFTWTIQCSNGQTNSGTGATNGTKSLALSSLVYSTTYKVWVNATDPGGSSLYNKKWYTFTTENQSMTIAQPSSYTIKRGMYVSGSLPDLYESDNQYLSILAGFTISSNEPPVWVEIEGTAPLSTPSQLIFTFEAHINSPGMVIQTITLFNYTTGNYEIFDSRTATLTDQVVTITLTNAAVHYIHPETKQMKAQYMWKQTGPTSMFPWKISIDESNWAIWS